MITMMIGSCVFSVVIDRRANRAADTGKFEICYQARPIPAPSYIGINLTVCGSAMRRPTAVWNSGITTENGVPTKPIRNGHLQEIQPNNAAPQKLRQPQIHLDNSVVLSMQNGTPATSVVATTKSKAKEQCLKNEKYCAAEKLTQPQEESSHPKSETIFSKKVRLIPLVSIYMYLVLCKMLFQYIDCFPGKKCPSTC